MPKYDDIARRLKMLDEGVSRLATASAEAAAATSDARDEALTFTGLGVLHLQATAAVEQAHALHRIAEALEAFGRGEQVPA